MLFQVSFLHHRNSYILLDPKLADYYILNYNKIHKYQDFGILLQLRFFLEDFQSFQDLIEVVFHHGNLQRDNLKVFEFQGTMGSAILHLYAVFIILFTLVSGIPAKTSIWINTTINSC